jgi:hypothetical protein
MAEAPPGSTNVGASARVTMDFEQFDEFIRALNDDFDVRGPVVTSGTIVTGPIRRATELPIGWHAELERPGHLRRQRL